MVSENTQLLNSLDKKALTSELYRNNLTNTEKDGKILSCIQELRSSGLISDGL